MQTEITRKLYRDYIPLVRKRIHKYGIHKTEDVEDIVQDVFVHFHAKYDPERAKPTTFLYQSIQDVMWDHLRNSKTKQLHLNTAVKYDGSKKMCEFIMNSIVEDVTHELVYESMNNAELIAAIKLLTEKQRQVITLLFVDSRTQKETGATIGVSESRVNQIKWDALKRLRELLDGKLCAA
jgi:RNA polymerase sigma factor (sigma-70 family)